MTLAELQSLISGLGPLSVTGSQGVIPGYTDGRTGTVYGSNILSQLLPGVRLVPNQRAELAGDQQTMVDDPSLGFGLFYDTGGGQFVRGDVGADGTVSGLRYDRDSGIGSALENTVGDALTNYGWAIPLAFAGAGAAGLLGGSGGAAAAAGAYVSPEIAGMAAQTIPAAGTSSTGLLGGLGGLMDGIAPALPSGTGFGLTGGTGLSGGTIMGDALLTGGGLAPGIATATAGGSNMGWLSNAFDWITGDTGSNILGRLGSSAIQGLFANNTANSNIDAARDSLLAQMALGNRALDEARFKPVNVTSNLGSTSWEIGPDGKPTAATANLSPQMQQLIAQAMSKGLDTLGGISAGTPEQLAQAEFQRYLDYARPKQNDLFSSLQNRMSAQGVLGFGVGDTNATSYNPLYRDFASGIADSDYNAYKQSQTLAQDLTNSTLKRALTLFGAGTEADAYGTNLLKLSGELGGRNVNAAGANALLTAGTAGNQSLLSATQAGNAAVGSIFGNAAQQMGPLLTAILGGLK